MANTKISALTAITAPQDPAKMYVPLYAQDGTPLNARMSVAEMVKIPKLVEIASGTLTGSSAPALSITQTWNNAATTFTGALINVTDTASNAASKLLDLQMGGSSRFRVQRDGYVVSASGIEGSYLVSVGPGFYARTSAAVFALGTSDDVVLTRDAADVLALRRSTNAELVRVYETYTDSTTFSRGVFGFRDSASGGTGAGSATTVLRIGTEKGTVGGAARAVEFVTDGVARINIDTAGNIQCLTSGTNFTGQWVNATQNLRVLNNSGAVLLGASSDVGMTRPAANILGITNGSTGGGAIEFTEMTAPAAPGGDKARLFVRDNGSSKSQLCVIFPTGAIQVLATEP